MERKPLPLQAGKVSCVQLWCKRLAPLSLKSLMGVVPETAKVAWCGTGDCASRSTLHQVRVGAVLADKQGGVTATERSSKPLDRKLVECPKLLSVWPPSWISCVVPEAAGPNVGTQSPTMP